MRTALFGLLGLLVLVGASCDGRAVYVEVSWVDIPAGTFDMGSPPGELCREQGQFKETQHRVTLTRPFQMMVTEATQAQFEAVLGYNPAPSFTCGPECPVDGVSWHEAASFCNGLSTDKGLSRCYECTAQGQSVECKEAAAAAGTGIQGCPGYRLPTEAEWEYACRAGTTTAFYNGPPSVCQGFDPLAGEIGWYQANSGMLMHRAGMKRPNAWGLHDMSGSTWEWVHDWFQKDLGSAAATNPLGAAEAGATGRVLRGGSGEVPAGLLRSASRYNYAEPAQRLRFHGFRCVRSKAQ